MLCKRTPFLYKKKRFLGPGDQFQNWGPGAPIPARQESNRNGGPAALFRPHALSLDLCIAYYVPRWQRVAGHLYTREASKKTGGRHDIEVPVRLHTGHTSTVAGKADDLYG